MNTFLRTFGSKKFGYHQIYITINKNRQMIKTIQSLQTLL